MKRKWLNYFCEFWVFGEEPAGDGGTVDGPVWPFIGDASIVISVPVCKKIDRAMSFGVKRIDQNPGNDFHNDI